MSVTEIAGSPGNWSLKLKENTPAEITQRLSMGSAIFITPTYSPGRTVTYNNALSGGMDSLGAIYGGIMFSRSIRQRTISGVNFLGYLVSSKGVAGKIALAGGPQYITSGTGVNTVWDALTYPCTFAQAVVGCFQTYVFGGATYWYSNGIAWSDVSACSATYTIPGPPADKYRGIKDVLDEWAQATGNQWKITPFGGVIAAANLSTTRKVTLSPDFAATHPGDSGYLNVAVDPDEWDLSVKTDTIRNGLYVPVYNGFSYTVQAQVGCSTPSTGRAGEPSLYWRNMRPVQGNSSPGNTGAYIGMADNAIYWNDSSTTIQAIADNSTSSNAASNAWLQYGTKVSLALRAQFDMPDWPLRVSAGDTVQVRDSIEQVRQSVIINSHTWPVREGYGVYLAPGDSTIVRSSAYGAYAANSTSPIESTDDIDMIDITRWVEKEEDLVSIDCTQYVPTLNGSRPQIASYR